MVFGLPSLRLVPGLRKQRLERLGGEPLAPKLGRHLGRPALPVGERPRPLGFRLQGSHRGGRRLAGDAVLREQVQDRLVAVAAAREGGGPPGRVAPVVDPADALERLERVGAGRLVHACPFEPVLHLAPRAVAVPQRPRGEIDRIGCAQTAAASSSSSRTGVASFETSPCGSSRAEIT